MATVCFSSKTFYLLPVPLLFFPLSDSHSLPPYLCSADKDFSAVKESMCLVRNTYHIYISICMLQCSLSKHLMPRCLLVWHPPVPKLCLFSVWIKESERLSQLSPSMRIRYCHLLSAVISLPSSDSLSGAAIRHNVSLLCVFVRVFVAPCKFCMLSHPILCFQWLYPKADFDASLR